ncbi:flavin monoamine oxidase family protein [Halobacillus sp. Marseille-Q1614]|uniref:flavin monoamine oxidase family protein n=1 Tax=Halobacillus sp. Marseille-Q1614 TaxID=2709134 RepID=UPI00156EAE73|nr:flavin monoamine oxidase family protein [Halobacillus sp. Marseille-Q1614]
MREQEEFSLQYPDDMLSIIRYGLDETSSPKRVIIIGGGMAGLTAASLLKQAGHQVIILEGNNRIGGRVYTIREPFSPGNYLDMGAMRIPDNHSLVMEYINRFQLPVHTFNNSSPEDLIFVNNVLTTRKEYEENPDILNFPVDEDEKGKTALELLIEATQPFLDLYEKSSPEEREQLEDEYGKYSIGDFLHYNPLGKPLSLSAIRSIGVMLGLEGFPNFSFVDILTDIIYPIFSKTVKFLEIEGGNDYLPRAFLQQLYANIYLNQKVERIYQTQEGVRIQTRNPQNKKVNYFYGDYAIVTVPFSVFQFIDVVPYDSIPFKKWQIIRELTNVPAAKIGIEFKSRFWERNQVGNAVSDRTTQFSYVPSHGIGAKGPAVMLASYGWGEDALLWASAPPEVMIREVLKDLSKIYGDIVYKEYIQTVAFNWTLNPFSAGCFTLFTPGQGKEFSEIIRRPEGRLHFAGEHTSSFHGWIEGAIESGIRTAYEVNSRDS